MAQDPAFNDNEVDLIRKLVENTKEIAELEAGDVASISGTANQIATSAAVGNVTLSIPAVFIAPGTIASTTSIQAGTAFLGLNGQTITGNASGAWAVAANGTNQSITLAPSGTGNVVLDISGGGYLRLSSTQNFASRDSTNTYLFTGSTAMRWRNQADSATIAMLTNGGNLLLGGLTTDGTGLTQRPASTTATGGDTHGSDLSWYRRAAGAFALDHVGGSAPRLYFAENSSLAGWIDTSSGTMRVASNTANPLILQTNNTTALTLDSSQNGILVGNFTVGAAKSIGWSSSTSMDAPSNGVLRLLNAAGSDFTRLQFGGSSSGFPALARASAGLTLQLADGTTGGYLGVGIAASSSSAITAAAATTALASLRLPHGTAPSAPVDGDMWTTTAGLFVRINGATVGPLS